MSIKNELVLPIGSKALINCPPTPGTRVEPPPTTDGSGRELSVVLIDGQEVELMAWRPHARHGLSYRIRRLSDGAECWIRALYLRKRPEPAAVARAR